MTEPVNASGLSWGVSSLGCAEFSLPEICELLSEFRLRELEMRAVDGRIDLPQWAVDKGWPPYRAGALMAKHNIRFRVAGSSFKLVGNDEKSRAEMLALCQWADSWGAPYVRNFGGVAWGHPLNEADYDQ